MRARWPALAALLLTAGCLSETKLQPLPAATTTPAGAAVAEAHGVRLVADGDAWRGNPSHLESIVTPVRVRLENQSGRPLRVRYELFELVGESRFSYAALSPFELRGEGLAIGGSGPSVSLGVGVGVGPRRFWGPGPWYDPWRPWSAWGPGFYDPWYDPFWGPGFGPYRSGYWRPPEPLPTQDMVRRALPEGTLEEGGTVAGFLYFQDVSEREGRVTLQAHLVDARTGERFGTLSIPFQVES